MAVGLVEIDGVHTASERATRKKHINQLLNDRFNSSTLRWGQNIAGLPLDPPRLIRPRRDVLDDSLALVQNHVLLLLFGST